MAKADWEFRKADQRTAKDADQSEFLAVKFGSCALDEGVRDDRTADAMDDFGTLDAATDEPWAVEDSKADDAVGSIAVEIERRAQLMQDFYPFVKDGNALTYRPSRTLAYELCLAISNAPTLRDKPYNVLPPAFERLCRDVVGCFLGGGAGTMRTGWPIDGEDERTAKFKSVVDKMNHETKEWVWHPAPGMPPDPSHIDVKDLGIDFAVWKRLPDGRKGVLFLLGQCACGDDWTEKFDDLNIQKIEENWFRFFSVAAPMRLFCVPGHIPNATYFDEVNRSAGLTLDRARIVMLAESEPHRATISAGTPTPFSEFVKLVINGFEVAPSAPAPRRRTRGEAPRSRSRGRAGGPNRP
ncbi:MAG: hypothetical protein HY040_25660 [Planctomycetes bacterium]|nr:hypothetical protein [Planctomycetota bacterium]